jgi:hypothetical protein
MARYWAHILKEYNAAGTASEFRGTNVKQASTSYGYASGGTKGTDYIIPDIEDQSLVITDTNNFVPVVSYASKGGVRHGVVTGYSVNGSFGTKLYREQADFLLDAALAKESATNPLGDIPSFQVDRCFWDSDPIAPRLRADSYKGVKFGAFGLSVGAQSPIVQCQFQLVGSTCTPITVTSGVPAKGKEPACTEYPMNLFTFKHTSVYIDFDGTPLYTTTGGTKSWATPDRGKLVTVRSVALSFVNQLATSSHSDGVLDRIQKTSQAVQISLVVDLTDPDGTGSEDSGYGSLIYRKRYRDMRDAVTNGRNAIAVVIDDGTKKISFDLGSNVVFDGLADITPIPDIFAAQISGTVLYDPANCNTFDWNVS